ncbi:MAG: hypothetical protein Q9188_006492 [Gyalolechia gomerana]
MVASEVQDEFEIPAFELTEKDRQNLARKDEDFQPHTWENLKQIIAKIPHQATNDLESLRRWPSDLKQYLQWTKLTKQKYTTITNFICTERLRWTPLPPSHPSEGPTFPVENSTPFAHPSDYKILLNDWPYGLTSEITHLVVWLKTRLAVDSTVGDLTPEGRGQIERFVKETFRDRIERDGGRGGEQVMWFRNWTGLQSVRGIDHIHVLVRGVGEGVLDEWTGGRRVLP